MITSAADEVLSAQAQYQQRDTGAGDKFERDKPEHTAHGCVEKTLPL